MECTGDTLSRGSGRARLKAPVSKTGDGESRPSVQIAPAPPSQDREESSWLLSCPNCHRDTKLVIVRSQQVAAGIRRIRRCEHCGESYTTQEDVVGTKATADRHYLARLVKQLRLMAEQLDHALGEPPKDEDVTP